MDTIRQLRRRRGWTQTDLAEEAELNLDTISGIETGRHEPRPSTLRKLAQALGVEIADLFLEPDSPKSEAPDTLDRVRALSPGSRRRLLLGAFGDEASVGGLVEARAVAGRLGISLEQLRDHLVREIIVEGPFTARSMLIGTDRGRKAQDEALVAYVRAQQFGVKQGTLNEAEMGRNILAFEAA